MSNTNATKTTKPTASQVRFLRNCAKGWVPHDENATTRICMKRGWSGQDYLTEEGRKVLALAESKS